MKKTLKFRAGMSLAELVVYIFIFALISTPIYSILIGSMRNYQLEVASTEVQETVQSATYRLSKELEESTPSSIVISSSGVVGVSFESARDANFRMQYIYAGNPIAGCGSATAGLIGMPCWHQYVGYYLDADPSAPGELALYRKIQTHSDSWTPGVPGAPSTFQSNGALPAILVARHLSNSGFSLTQNGTMYLLAITANHSYGNPNSYSAQVNINIRQ